MPLFLTSSQIALPTMRFMVPHREEPWSAKKLERRFPQLIDAFDGTSQDSVLTFFYKINKAEGIFEFIDEEAEDDFADLLGVKVLCQEIQDEVPDSTPLTNEQLDMHRNNMSMIREGLDFLKNPHIYQNDNT